MSLTSREQACIEALNLASDAATIIQAARNEADIAMLRQAELWRENRTLTARVQQLAAVQQTNRFWLGLSVPALAAAAISVAAHAGFDGKLPAVAEIACAVLICILASLAILAFIAGLSDYDPPAPPAPPTEAA